MNSGESQTTDTLLMVRPARFGFNFETAESNVFQRNSLLGKNEIQSEALQEFDAFVKKLRSNKIYVIVLQDDGNLDTPDSIFPNNWISFLEGKMILYPMMAMSRRQERNQKWIQLLKHALNVKQIIDLSSEEQHGKFLEGTGSLVIDHRNKIAFANQSSRTDADLFQSWCTRLNFEPVMFRAYTNDGKEIYHTNVVISIGDKTAVICTEVIRDFTERKSVLEKLSATHRIVEISEEQMNHFCGNLLRVRNRDGKNFWVMSQQAFNSFSSSQKEILNLDGEILFSDLKTVEAVGGGSARCMMAEIC